MRRHVDRGRALVALAAGVSVMVAGAPAASAAAPLFGYNDNAFVAHDVDADTDTRLLAQGGANVARVTFDWRWAEPQPGQYELARYDDLYESALARGVKLVLTVLYAPSWAHEPGTNCSQWLKDCRYPPGRAHDDAWDAILAKLATRYPEAAAIELWNEPNYAAFWPPAPDPARYTELLRSGYAAIKAVNPSMPVLLGGLANLHVNDSRGLAMRGFLNSVYANGGKGSFDGLSFHDYSRTLGDALFYKTLGDVLEVRDLYDDRATPLWLTEGGLTTTGAEAVTEAEQARGLLHQYRVLADRPYIEAVMFHTLLEGERGELYRGTGFGVVRRTLEPKPAYCALATERGSSFTCPPSIKVARSEPVEEANWASQSYAQLALEAANEYYRRSKSYIGFTNAVMHEIDPRLSATPAPVSAAPGPSADPSRLAVITTTNPGELTVCSASRGTYAYCILRIRGTLTYYFDRSTVNIWGAIFNVRRNTGWYWG